MPMLSSFYGIVIKMYFKQKEHNPPHIHAIYGDYLGVIDINNCALINGDLPDKAFSLVKEWINIHKTELLYIWNTQNFSKLPPLE